jgi:CBS domain-containing protein
MRCQSIMQKDVISIGHQESALKAALLMRHHNIGFLPVCDGAGRAIGVITDRDLAMRLCAENGSPAGTAVEELMSRDVVSCQPHETLERAEELMAKHGKQRILILDEVGTPVGVVSFVDVIERDSNKNAARTYRQIALREYRF